MQQPRRWLVAVLLAATALTLAEAVIRVPQGFGECDLDTGCDWLYSATGKPFEMVKPPLPYQLAPTADASANTTGKFLWLSGNNTGHLYSKVIPRAQSTCKLEVALYQIDMANGNISLIVEPYNILGKKQENRSYVAKDNHGNNRATWETYSFNLGGISQDFGVVLEFQLPFPNSSIAIDNVRLLNCFPKARNFFHENCNTSAELFRCNDGSCLVRDHMCDLTADCTDAEDETGECDKLPEYAKCNFESGWCGWTNNLQQRVNWTLQRGTWPDHTYRNTSGTYITADMSKHQFEYGRRVTLNSPIFNPPPPVQHDVDSPYFGSCKVRFYYRLYGTTYVGLGLYIVHLKPHINESVQVFWTFKEKNVGMWQDQVKTLPKIEYKYFLQFEVSQSYETKIGVAIDDISLSPECFGIGIPPDILGDYNYYTQKIINVPPKHADFTNATMIDVTTCGQTGRMGPTPEHCVEAYNSTDVEVLSGSSTDEGDAKLRLKGIQRWTAPSGGYYTLIAMGARGGAGAVAVGTSLGALARGVVELAKGQKLYFMVGQFGTDACPKRLGSHTVSCQQYNGYNGTNEGTSSVRQVKNFELKDGAGGGGGATYIFTLRENGEQEPLLIAGGGGGLGPTQFIDDGEQHAKGLPPDGRYPSGGTSYKNNSGGGGGGWIPRSDDKSSRDASGMALTLGGIGGIGCGPNNDSDGGFGGGGGGCLSGGGGGGYAGGVTGHKESGNGEGGYSYVALDLLHADYVPKMNAGPGRAFVISAISGCGCDYRCVVIDQHLSQTRCVCPQGWQLSNDSKSCIMLNASDATYTVFIVIISVVIFILLFSLSCLCFILYNRYQKRKDLERRRQVMFGNGTELTSLRVVSDSMMTEFNPNYEFGGNLYSFKDLSQIPRDNIALVKPLGQGAFGEVFQGVYKYSHNEEHPVAVKTLPSVSTSQAEADFMMEALIMSKFKHPNIVQFIGVSFDMHPRYIILELLAGGDLKNFLREERPRPDRPTTLTMQNLIMCGHDVAKGCKYMEDARFIHRDIAARNCLLTCKGPGRVVKIADFGMARDIYRSDYYRKGGKAMLPIKWMPPESFLDGIFTTKTDVWAFGVLLWEIMSFGYMPYTGCANREVMTMVTSGGRLERPAGCPDPIYGIMTRCWHPHPEERPSFATIVERIGYCLQDPDVINHPTPNYDLLPICDREITIMRPDPETECINVHADLDGCGYMQPRTNFRPSTYRIGQPPGIVYASLRHSSEDRDNRNNLRSEPSHRGPEDSPPREHYHSHSSAPEEHDLDDVCDNRDHSSRQESEPNANVASSSLVPESDVNVAEVGIINTNSADPKQQPGGHNGNGESTTTTDTNSDSIFIPSSGTPPDTASSSPNTRHSSPNHVRGLGNNGNGSPNNVNGIIRKTALKAALSLDPSALCRGIIPYEKIAFSPPKPRLSNPGSTELRKDSLSHELPREEECSC